MGRAQKVGCPQKIVVQGEAVRIKRRVIGVLRQRRSGLQMPQNCRLEMGQRVDRFGQKSCRPRRQRRLVPCGVAAGAQHDQSRPAPPGQPPDQVGTVAVGQAQINDHDIGAVD